MNALQIPIPRRSFLHGLTALAAAGFMPTALAKAVADAIDDFGNYTWAACVINCGNRCPLRVYTKAGKVIRIETDNTIKDSCHPRQIRACLKGRSMRQRLYSPDRLRYPMKRVGERGEAKFERISWDEAYKTIAKRWKEIKEKYGNESIYWNYCSGQQSLVNSRRAWQRLMNLMGGYLRYYGSYSSAQISAAFPFTYGKKAASGIQEIANAKLYVAFGNNPSVTRGSGGSKGYQFRCALEKGHPKTIVIDPIYTDTVAGKIDQWIPIRPGTDAALVEAIAYELIRNNWVDEAFLEKYCIGYNEKTLPKSAPPKSDYKSYIMGAADGVAKTPERASRITGIPVETIVNLAKEIGTTKPVFIAQGLGPQRQANGEQTARAIAMLPILTGQIGLPGTSTGMEEDGTNWKPTYLPVGTNPIKAQIPVFLWTDAILRGEQMDWIHDGVKGLEEGKKLGHSIKMIVNSGGNTLIVDVRDYTDFALLGATRDDAAGECFDKAARVLGLPYPGGAAMDKLAHESEGGVYELPRAKIDGCPLDMSFSGLKTAVVNLAHNAEQTGKQLDRAALARDFTQAVVDELVPRAMLAMQQSGRKVLVAAGGVAANSFIRAELEKECRKHGHRLYMPPLKLCGDNGAMIGAQGYYEYLAGARADWALNAYATRDIDDPIV